MIYLSISLSAIGILLLPLSRLTVHFMRHRRSPGKWADYAYARHFLIICRIIAFILCLTALAIILIVERTL